MPTPASPDSYEVTLDSLLEGYDLIALVVQASRAANGSGRFNATT